MRKAAVLWILAIGGAIFLLVFLLQSRSTTALFKDSNSERREETEKTETGQDSTRPVDHSDSPDTQSSERPRWIRFSVQTPTGLLVENCVATLLHLDKISPLLLETRGVRGEFRIQSTNEESELLLAAPEHEPVALRVPVGTQDVDLGVIELLPKHKLVVLVVNGFGDPVPDAEIKIANVERRESDPLKWRLAGRTSHTGKLLISIGGESVFLQATKGKGKSRTLPCSSRAEKIQLVLSEKPNVICRFIDEAGAPIEAVRCLVFPGRAPDWFRDDPIVDQLTNEDGILSFIADPGTYCIRFPENRWRPTTGRSSRIPIEVGVSPNKYTFNLSPQSTLGLRVLDAHTKKLIEHFSVVLFTERSAPRDTFPDPAHTMFHENGRASLPLPPSGMEFGLAVRAEGYTETRLENPPILDVLEIRLQRSKSLLVRFAYDGNAPAENHFVRIRQNYSKDPFDVTQGRVTANGRTDRNGSWVATDWIPGPAAIDASIDGRLYVCCATIPFDPSPSPVSVMVPRNGEVRLTFEQALPQLPNLVLRQGNRGRGPHVWPFRRGNELVFGPIPPGLYQIGSKNDMALWDWKNSAGLDGPKIVEVLPRRTTKVLLEDRLPITARIEGAVHGLSPEYTHWITWTPEPQIPKHTDWPIRFGIDSAARQLIDVSGAFTLETPLNEPIVLCVLTEVESELVPSHLELIVVAGQNHRINLEWNPAIISIEPNPSNVCGQRLALGRDRRHLIRWAGHPRLLSPTPIAPGAYHFRSSAGADLNLELSAGEKRMLSRGDVEFRRGDQPK